MRIDNPQYFLFLFIPVCIALVSFPAYLMGRSSIAALTKRPENEDFFTRYLVKSFFSLLFFLLFSVFAVLALVGFSWGRTPVEEDRSGLDVIFVVDVSRSMLARDTSPDRLTAAANLARGLIGGLPSVRFGVVAFKGVGVTVVPMTEDRFVLESFFDQISPSVLGSPGTSLESGLERAVESFPPATERHRLIMVLSDGESSSGSPKAAAVKAAEQGIPVFTVGFGTLEGSRIPLKDGGFVLDRNEKPVVTRLEEELLKDIALSAEGVYYSADEPGIVSRVIEGIRGYEESRLKLGFRLALTRRYRVFLLLAFFFLVCHVFIRSLRWKSLA